MEKINYSDIFYDIEKFKLITKSIVQGFITGQHQSPFHGFSVEFSDHRPYNSGDSIDHVDWKIFAKTNKYFIKRYEDETNVRIYFLIDHSLSMKYTSQNISKMNYAKLIVSTMSYLALKQRDAVGLFAFNEDITHYLPAKSKQNWLEQILVTLNNIECQGITNLSSSLNFIAEKIKKRNLIVVISDFLDDADELIKALNHFKYNQNDLIAINILDPKEFEMDFKNLIEMHDLETDEIINLYPWAIQKDYKQILSEHLEKIQFELNKLNYDYLQINTKFSFNDLLTNYLIKRNKMY